MSSADRWTWTRYRTGTWHAYGPRDCASLCGLATRRTDDQGHAKPRSRACKTCKKIAGEHAERELRRREATRQADGPAPVPHRGDVDRCACPNCRRRRRAGAEEYLKAARKGVGKVACRHVRQWPGSREYVHEAEARLGALLMAWEMDGRSSGALGADIRAAGRELHDAWREARDRYDVLDGRHGREVG